MGGQPTKQRQSGDIESGMQSSNRQLGNASSAGIQQSNSPQKGGPKRSTIYEVQQTHLQQHSNSARCLTTNSGVITDWIAINPAKRDVFQTYQSLLNQLRSDQNHLEYEDPNFPAQLSSVSREKAFDRASNITWKRPSQFIKGNGVASIFSKDASPCDIIEGNLKDQYFTSALSILAERRGYVESLFESQKINQNGCYCVWLCQDGEWTSVIIDDILPCASKTGLPSFSRANDNSIWVSLLEKAYAKMYGAFDKIESGLLGHALFDLTGAPYSYFIRDHGQMVSEKELWDLVQENVIQKNYIVAGNNENNTRELSIIQVKSSDIQSTDKHSYCILDAKEVVDSEGQRDRILKIRNPWNDYQWKGDWSQNSYKWTKSLLAQVNQSEENVFWMSVHDFTNQFSQLVISKVHENYVHSSIRASKALIQEKVTTRVFTMKVFSNQSNCSFVTVSQRDKRVFTKSQVPHNYSLFRIMMVSLCSSTSESPTKIDSFISGNYDCERDTSIEIQQPLAAGVYLIYIEADWAQEEWREFVLSCYSETAVEFQEIKNSTGKFIDVDKGQKPQNMEALIEDLLEAHQEKEESSRVHKFNDQIFRTTGSIAGYVYFLYENISIDVHLREEIYMKDRQYIELCMPKPLGEKVRVSVAPGDRQIIKYRADSKGRGEYSYSSSVNYILLQSVNPNDEDKLKQLALIQPSKIKQREMNGFLMKVFVHTFVYHGGVCFLYINKTSQKTYIEDLSLEVSNLRSVKYNLSAPFRIEVPPLQQMLINLATIDLDEEISYKPRMSFFLR